MGQPQDLVSQKQEQDAIKNYGNQLSNNPGGAKEIVNAKLDFSGGQTPGVEYLVTIKEDWRKSDGSSWNDIRQLQPQVTGPVKGLGTNEPKNPNGIYGLKHGVNEITTLTVNYQAKIAWPPTFAATYAIYSIISIFRVDGKPDPRGNPPPIEPGSSLENDGYPLPSPKNLSNGNPFNSSNPFNFPNPFNSPNPFSSPNPFNSTNGSSSSAGGSPGLGPLSNSENDALGQNYPGAGLGNPPKDNFNQPADYPLAPGWRPVNGTFDYPTTGTTKNTYVIHDPVLEAQKKAQKNKNPTAPEFTGNPVEQTNKKPENFDLIIPPVLLRNPNGTVTSPTPVGKDVTNPNNLKAPEPTQTQTPVPSELCQSPCFTNLRNDVGATKQNTINNQRSLDALNTGLNAGEAGGIAAILAKLNTMDAFLIAKFTALWQHRLIDRALALLNIAIGIHNAVMLSNNIAITLKSAIENVMSLIGIKDPDGVTKGFSDAIGSTVENLIKSVIGAENYTNLVFEWKKANRTYQAVTNSLNLIYDSMSGIAEGLKIVGKYHAKVGNALLRSGEILENSFGWMNETLHFKTGKIGLIDRVIRGLNTAQEVTEDLEQVTSGLRSVQDNVNEMKEELKRVNDENEAAEKAKLDEQKLAKKASVTSAEIKPSDLVQPATE